MIARLFLLLLTLLAPVATLHAAPVKVFAASSLTEAINAVADAYAATGKERPLLVLAGTPALARQIMAGAPAGVFVSADEEWMDAVAAAGAIDVASRRDIATNRLVVIVPGDRPRRVRIGHGFDFAGFVGKGRWTTGNPDSVPVGRYARAALTSLGAWDAAAPRLARAENVRAALAFVERGDAAAGIVYATDARASGKVAVAGMFPAGSHPAIRYPAALVRAGEDAGARAFLAFLSGPKARAVLLAQGFGRP